MSFRVLGSTEANSATERRFLNASAMRASAEPIIDAKALCLIASRPLSTIAIFDLPLGGLRMAAGMI
jgi:hypothetical protein